ncbi:MAG: IgGFc-binding protein [Armatimonadetes bacterium]|nr:IgGFc-binding protein [Armatimonadota bacterium]
MQPLFAPARCHAFLVAAVVLCAVVGLHARLSAQPLDRLTTGRTYLIAFPDTSGNRYDLRYPSKIISTMQVMIYSATDGNRVTITNNATKQASQHAIAAGTFQTITLSGSVVDGSGVVSNNTWRVDAAAPVVLYCYIATSFGAEAWTPLPLETWGTEYYVNTMPGDVVNDVGSTTFGYTRVARAAPAELLILSAFDGTHVTIFPKGAIAGFPKTVDVQLQAGQAYQIQSFVDTSLENLGAPQPDITGTLVTSNNPISVIAATTRTANRDLGAGLGQNSMKNPLIEAMPPRRQWGTAFLYLPTADSSRPAGEPNEKLEERRPHEVVRLIAGDSAAAVRLASMTNAAGTFDTTSVSGWKGVTFALGTPNPAYFLADTPAMAMMSSSSAVRFNGTTITWGESVNANYQAVAVPYMVELTPREQWPNAAPFMAQHSMPGMTHYVNIAVAASERSKLRMKMNGVEVALPTATSVGFKRNAWMSIPGTDLEWLVMELSPTATYLLYGSDASVHFYGYVYGGRAGYEGFIPGEDKGYKEEVGLAYGYPIAPQRRVLAAPDSVEIEQSSLCGRMRVMIQNTNKLPAGFAEAYIEPAAANARIEYRDPVIPDEILMKTNVDLQVVPIDPTKDAQATLVVVDRTGYQHRFPYNYVGMNIRFTPSDSAVDFGELPANAPPRDTAITICNPTGHDVQISSVRLNDPNSQFTLDTSATQLPITLPAGGCMAVAVRVAPAATAKGHADSLSVSFGYGCSNKAIALHAKTVTYCVYMGDLDFGTFHPADGFRTLELKICNQGTGTLTFADSNGVGVLSWGDTSFSVPPFVIAQLQSAKLKPGECFSVPVTFMPQRLGIAQTTARAFANARSCRDTSRWTAAVMPPLDVANKPDAEEGKWWIAHNTPNPFSSRTHIEFSVGKRGETRGAIYNEAGVEVATIVEKVLEAGTHHLEWDASEFPSGRYFCRITSSGWEGVIPLTVSR